jgi:2',3'-cyclic-nucleotide 2'-phosphodiesterase (5'-nucleotidase family)
MSMMKYDASTMGNHDFDNGLDGFLKVLPNAKFPLSVQIMILKIQYWTEKLSI